MIGWFLLALGCGTPDDRTPLVVFAASSLTEAFGAVEESFEAAHPHIDVQVVLAGSQVLRMQIEQGAAVDVFASANPHHVNGVVDTPHTFAHNELVVIVPSGNPAGVQRFEDLPNAHRIVLGTDTVPIGRYARTVLNRANPEFAAAVRQRVVSKEANVRLVRAKVALGEADAAFVYRTDALASSVQTVPVPEDLNVRADYPIGVVTTAPHRAEARTFIDFVTSREGQDVLTQYGFLRPDVAE
ncbi:MAG: molybdate ABC transporter substrate-binding protein [Myxococcota bacterium]